MACGLSGAGDGDGDGAAATAAAAAEEEGTAGAGGVNTSSSPPHVAGAEGGPSAERDGGDKSGGLIAVSSAGSDSGPGGLVAVGLDVGTGWVKVSARGRRAMFPSLYSCTYAPGSGDADIIKGAEEKGKPKAVLRDAVGEAAAAMASGRFATLIRPVKHGVPHDGRGYSRLAAEALRAVGIDDPSMAVICAGVPYDSRADRDRIKRLIRAAVKPAFCAVLPQAYGTLKACGLKAGTVVNIGHGTTEIMRVGSEGVYGVSIQRASEFVLQQLAQRQGRTGRDAYTDHDAVLAEDPKMAARLVELLAVHIADEIQQFGAPSRTAPEGGGSAGGAGIILSGGGSRLTGMKEALKGALGGAVDVLMVDEPSYSNAIGLEMMARDAFGEAQKALAARRLEKDGAAPGKGGAAAPPRPAEGHGAAAMSSAGDAGAGQRALLA